MAMYNLVRICHLFRISMAEIATLDFSAPKTCHETDLLPYTGTLVTNQKPIDWPGIHATFSDIITGKKPPVTVRSIAEMHGCDVSSLYLKYQGLCKQVAKMNFESRQNTQNQKVSELKTRIKDHINSEVFGGTVPTKVQIYVRFGGRSLKRQALLKDIFGEMGL